MLFASIPTYKYEDLTSLRNTVAREVRKQSCGNKANPNVDVAMKFTNVKLDVINTLNCNGWRDMGRLLKFWDKAEFTMVLRSSPLPHEVAKEELSNVINDASQDIGKFMEFWSTRATSYPLSDDGWVGMYGLSATGSWKWQGRSLNSKQPSLWPELVLETTYSDDKTHLDMLRESVRYWMTESEGNVKACLTLHMSPSSRKLTLSLWGPDLAEPEAVMVVEGVFQGKRYMYTRTSETRTIKIPWSRIVGGHGMQRRNEIFLTIYGDELERIAEKMDCGRSMEEEN
ncbi:hypothetical protein KEM56_002972 [Ascosphaera pollenicola]|nr:hypothetical protein KEM56_002972 [Ascosphaera pollenicola]